MNHHQLPFSQAMLNIPSVEYNFIATTPTPKFRLDLGYHDMNSAYDFIVCAYKNQQYYNEALELCAKADAVIIGSAPLIFIKQRLKQKKLTFKCSERIYRTKPPFYQIPLRFLKYFWVNSRHKNLYLLCNSAYTSADFAKTLTFINKAFKWGYFPETKIYDNLKNIIDKKENNSILLAGRLIPLKHPELAILTAKKLKADGYDFKLNIIGSGRKKSTISKMILENGLSDCVNLLGNMSPEQVREYMEKSQVFLFTSNRKEGWGVVLNEAMNSACAVVANSAIGSAPFLINNGIDGFMYNENLADDLYNKVKALLDDSKKSTSFSENAYNTIIHEWNAETAAKRFLILTNELLKLKPNRNLFKDGICSKAEIINENRI